jgi:hypothetical protein
MKKTKLSLDRAKPTVGLQRIRELSEHRWVCCQEVLSTTSRAVGADVTTAAHWPLGASHSPPAPT